MNSLNELLSWCITSHRRVKNSTLQGTHEQLMQTARVAALLRIRAPSIVASPAAREDGDLVRSIT